MRATGCCSCVCDWLHTTWTLSRRTLLATLRDPGVLLVRTLAAVSIGALTGVVFYQTTSVDARVKANLFVMCIFGLFCIPALSRYIEERVLFLRERAAGFYGTGAYFLAATAVELPVLGCVVAAYAPSSYFLIGLRPTAGAFATFTAVLVVVTLTGFSISQLVAACSRTVERAIAVYMLVFVYALLLGGFIIEKDKLPEDARWLVYTSFYYWGFGALVMNEFEGQPQVLRSLGFADGPGIWASVAILGGFFLALRVLAFVALWTTRH